MLQKTPAIVLRATKYGDQKLIVDFYTEVLGRVTCAVKISTTQRGKMKKQLFQPMTIVSVEVDYHQHKPMQKLCDIQLLKPWTTLTLDPVKTSMTLFISEILWYATRQEQGNSALFNFIVGSMEWLDLTSPSLFHETSGRGSIANFHLCFLIYLTKLLGFMPLEDTYEPASYFDMRQGVFTLLHPAHQDFLQPQEASYLLLLFRMRYNNMHLYKMSRSERQRCLHLIIYYFRLHLPSLPELKSMEVFHEIFS